MNSPSPFRKKHKEEVVFVHHNSKAQSISTQRNINNEDLANNFTRASYQQKRKPPSTKNFVERNKNIYRSGVKEEKTYLTMKSEKGVRGTS